jgi:hypothetical protein
MFEIMMKMRQKPSDLVVCGRFAIFSRGSICEERDLVWVWKGHEACGLPFSSS